MIVSSARIVAVPLEIAEPHGIVDRIVADVGLVIAPSMPTPNDATRVLK